MDNQLNKILISFIIVVITLSGCQEKKSILTEDVIYQYPCWQNIQPGISTSEETLVILRDLLFLASKPAVTPIKVNEEQSYDSWVFTNNIRETSGRIIFIGNIVAEIRFDTKGSTISEFIDYYGEPDYISAISGWADSKWLQVFFVYPTEGVMIVYYKNNWRSSDDSIKINEIMKIDEVIYFDPNLYNWVIESEVYDLDNKNQFQKNLKQWHGYGYDLQVIK